MSTSCVRVLSVVVGIVMFVVGCAPAAQPTPVATTAPTAVPKATAPVEAPKATAPAAKPAAEAPKAPPAAPKETAKVTLGVVAGVSDAAFFIANDKGYFKEQGLQVDLTPFDTAAKMVAPLAAGQLDAGGGSPSAGLYNAMARDIPLKIVADKGSVFEKDSYQGMVIRQDIWDSGKFKGYADLKGMKFALPAEGITPHVEVDAALKKGGLTLKDIDLVQLPFVDMPAAFAGKSIDAGVEIEPYITDLQEKKIARLFKGSNEFYPNHQVAVVLFSPNFAKDKADTARKFMVAYLKAARDYNDAFVKKDKKAFDEIVPILAKNTAVKNTELYAKMTMPGINPNGEVMVQSLKGDQDWYLAQGFQKSKIDIDTLVDHSYVKYAVQQLGQYK